MRGADCPHNADASVRYRAFGGEFVEAACTPVTAFTFLRLSRPSHDTVERIDGPITTLRQFCRSCGRLFRLVFPASVKRALRREFKGSGSVGLYGFVVSL